MARVAQRDVDWSRLIADAAAIMDDESARPRDRARARALYYRMTEGSGYAAAISVGSGFVLHRTQKPDGAGWAEHNSIEDGDG